MHQNVVSAFPAKRLIIKRVRAVVPQEAGMPVNRKQEFAWVGKQWQKT
jgi:hypothetical protein